MRRDICIVPHRVPEDVVAAAERGEVGLGRVMHVVVGVAALDLRELRESSIEELIFKLAVRNHLRLA